MSESSRISTPVIREFEYRPNRLQTALLFVLASAGEAMFCYFAVFLNQPVNVRGFQLTAAQARLLMAGFAVIGPIGLVALGAPLVSSMIHKRRIALTKESLILPKPSWHGLSTAEIEVPYASIISTTICPFIGKSLLLRLELESGAISIPNNMFPKRTDFDTFADLLSDARKATAERTSAAQDE